MKLALGIASSNALHIVANVGVGEDSIAPMYGSVARSTPPGRSAATMRRTASSSLPRR